MDLLTKYMSPSNIQLLSNILLMIFTGVLAYYSYYLHSETRKNRKFQIQLHQPELSVIFEPSRKYINWINIKIKNIGGSPLYNLELEKVDKNFTCFNGKKVSELKYLQKYNYLRPGQEIEQLFITLADGKNKAEDIQFSMYFKYSNENKKTFKKKFDYDFIQFYDMSQVGEDPLNKIANNIEKIQKNIGHLATGFSKLQVITQTKKEKSKETQDFIKQVQARAKKVKKK